MNCRHILIFLYLAACSSTEAPLDDSSALAPFAVNPLDLPAGVQAPGRPDHLQLAVGEWAREVPLLLIATVSTVEERLTDEEPGVVQDVTLTIDSWVREDIQLGLAEGEPLLLTVPGGHLGDLQVVTSEAPFFQEGDQALFAFTMDEEGPRLALGHRSALGLRDGVLLACVNPNMDAAMACIDVGLPFMVLDQVPALALHEAVQAVSPFDIDR